MSFLVGFICFLRFQIQQQYFSMTENIKIYRNSNRRLGFSLNETTLNNFYVDQESLRRLVDHINRQFLICSNRQSEYLLAGEVDFNNRFITVFGVMLILPLIKSLALENFTYLLYEYLLIFVMSAIFMGKAFARSDSMKEKYLQAEDELQKNFNAIREEFNSRFDYLQMEYRFGFNEQEEDYLEIRVIKKPDPLFQLEYRFKKYIQLLPVEA